MPANMEATLSPTINCKVHAIVHFFMVKNKGTIEIHHELCGMYDENIMSRQIVSC